MNIKIVPIIVGMLLCSSLHLHAGLFDSVSDLTGGLIKIEKKKDTADHGEDAEGEVLSKRARKYSKKMSHDEYIAERDAFISLVTEKYGVYASEFNLNNDDFAIIREMLPEDANGLSEKIGVLRGAVQSQLKYASHRKDGIKLLNKLSADEAEIDATFNSLKARAKQKQEELAAAQKAEREAREKAEREARELAAAQKAEREAREKAEREARELAATQKAEREAREKAERETRELVSSQEIIPHAKEVAGEVSAKETSENDIAAGNAVSAVSSSATGPVESESSTVQVECKLVLISLGVWFATVVVMGLIVFLSRKPSPDNIPKNVRACYFINRWDYAPTFLSIAVVLALPFCFARARLGEPWANALLVTCSLTVLAVNWLALFKANTSWGLATMMMPFRVIMGVLGPLLPLASVVMTFAGISAVNEGRKSLGAAKERIRANHGWASERDVRDINSGKSSISSGIATAIVGAIFGWISKKLWESINTRTRSLVGWESWD